MNRQAPIKAEQARLLTVGQPDLRDRIVADGGRVVGIGPDQDLIAVGVARVIYVSTSRGELASV